MHYVWQAPLALFLLYCELFSDRELFTDCELCDARTLAPPHMTHALQWQAPLALFLLYCELFSVRELFTNRELCDARTLAPPHVTHALRVASSVNSFLTMNSMTHALRLRPM